MTFDEVSITLLGVAIITLNLSYLFHLKWYHWRKP